MVVVVAKQRSAPKTSTNARFRDGGGSGKMTADPGGKRAWWWWRQDNDQPQKRAFVLVFGGGSGKGDGRRSRRDGGSDNDVAVDGSARNWPRASWEKGLRELFRDIKAKGTCNIYSILNKFFTT